MERDGETVESINVPYFELLENELDARVLEQIIATNLGRNAVDDREAFSLVLGSNSCAASQESLAGD